MSAWHLLWIVPVVFYLGFATCAILVAGSEADRRMEVLHAKVQREDK